MTAALVDERFYEAAGPRSVGERVAVAARDKIHADFLRLCRPEPDDEILDVGISDVVGDAANVLERTYPHPGRITAAGLGAAHAFQAAFPEVRYRQVEAGEPLPFADGRFDIACSNAVLEHVGGPAQQAAFVGELLRVARQVFISVPNRWFPVEHHTAIPLLHWSRPSFALACRALGKTAWLDPRELCLMDAARLRALAPQDRPWTVGRTGLPLGPFSSNLYLHAVRTA